MREKASRRKEPPTREEGKICYCRGKTEHLRINFAKADLLRRHAILSVDRSLEQSPLWLFPDNSARPIYKALYPKRDGSRPRTEVHVSLLLSCNTAVTCQTKPRLISDCKRHHGHPLSSVPNPGPAFRFVTSLPGCSSK
jgi:hypothetical protein